MTEEEYKELLNILYPEHFPLFLISNVIFWGFAQFTNGMLLLAPKGQNGLIVNREKWNAYVKLGNFLFDIVPAEDIDLYNVREDNESMKNRSYEKKKSGFVYVIQSNKYYKIGQTKKLNARLGDLSRTCPDGIELITSVFSEDVKSLEASFHHKFSSKRIHGEWFELDNNDIAYIKSFSIAEEDTDE